jgi:hypothetical protein
MSQSRANLGFDDVLSGTDDALSGFDPSDWAPDASVATRAKPAPTITRAAAERTGFKSREAGQGGVATAAKPASPSVAPAGQVRRRRTGRNAQFNLKARPETIAAYCAIADHNGWGLGETLEYAVTLLEQEYGQR